MDIRVSPQCRADQCSCRGPSDISGRRVADIEYYPGLWHPRGVNRQVSCSFQGTSPQELPLRGRNTHWRVFSARKSRGLRSTEPKFWLTHGSVASSPRGEELFTANWKLVPSRNSREPFRVDQGASQTAAVTSPGQGSTSTVDGRYRWREKDS